MHMVPSHITLLVSVVTLFEELEIMTDSKCKYRFEDPKHWCNSRPVKREYLQTVKSLNVRKV